MLSTEASAVVSPGSSQTSGGDYFAVLGVPGLTPTSDAEGLVTYPRRRTHSADVTAPSRPRCPMTRPGIPEPGLVIGLPPEASPHTAGAGDDGGHGVRPQRSRAHSRRAHHLLRPDPFAASCGGGRCARLPLARTTNATTQCRGGRAGRPRNRPGGAPAAMTVGAR